MSHTNEYFNLIVIGQDDEWILEKKGNLPLSRLFEYTTNQAREIFGNEKPSNFKKLEDLPCIFTHEGRGAAIYFGHITNLRRKNDGSLSFQISNADNKNINFQELYNRTKHNNLIDTFEYNRNHWAVKKGNIQDILNKPAPIHIIPESIIPGSVSEVKLTIEPSKEHQITSIQDLISRLSEAKDDETVFYRGHSDEKYKLEPSIFRQDDNGSYRYRDIEDKIYRELLSSSYAEFIDDNSTFDKLVHMQHFSLPTRLLDVTTNPLIALYFACKVGNSDKETVGDLISITLSEKAIKYFDSDTVACLSNLVKLNFQEKEKIFDAIQTSEENLKNKFLNYVRDDKPYFQDKIQPDDLHKIICVKGKITNPRIYAQSGAFLLFGLTHRLDDNNNLGIRITHYKIPHHAKSNILKTLDLLNINESTVFPYLENSAKYVTKKFGK
ncbi:FRG domain-containing protein [Wielerella bovis]|uniref:FRG domain-containing protein n=1 Tax=Wielerella bovis TaxID=2917790 RepID=UPI002019FA4C|nr:FRG domain-containing protein [Wielerella bovis]ULJ64267.1 FRG domain-containing protein [Wielerella bovis]ULJ66486.1 FRG domain-containing protein [Wielerella bovis]